jgi:signal transduction histidine kinase/DNA-binding response OmpR family regulator
VSNPVEGNAASPASDLVIWPARLIQASALVIILFEIASALGEAVHGLSLPSRLPVRAACVILGCLLFKLSQHRRLEQRWQPLAFIITSGVLALTTLLGIEGETADQFFVDLLILSLGVTSLLPWSFAWQAAANVLMLMGLAAFAVFSSSHDPLLYTHWIGLVAGAVIRQLCANYGGRAREEIARDVAELKRSETELIAAREAALAASQAKSEFLSTMSHEIRTPMNAVLGMADVLAETELNGEQCRYLDTIINNGTALLELINSILDLAKVESGRVSLEQVPFSPREVVERVLETLALRAHEKRLELVAQIDTQVPELVLGDPFRLRQILTNLVANAVKFTESGQVLVTLHPEGETAGLLQFEVHDTGIGIPENKLGSVFEPFTQADSSTTRQYGGSGLGLAIVARLVALMGGTAAAESRPGVGSVFRFSVCFARPTDPVPYQASLPYLPGRKILVVDDSEASCEAVRMLLEGQDAVVTVAHSGTAALQLLHGTSNRFDAIVLDSSMPELDGYDVVQQSGYPHHRFIMMLASSNLKMETVRLETLELPYYVVKPLKRNELLAVVAAAAGKRAPTVRALVQSDTRRQAHPPAVEHRLHILFADDSPDNRALIKAYMTSTPHTFDFAEDGKEAVARFMANQYDVVFMDIQMPILDGYAAVEQIRRWENHLGRTPTPVVALTASADTEAIRRTQQVGCNLHVSKPLKKATLFDTIDRCVTPPPQADASPAPPERQIA